MHNHAKKHCVASLSSHKPLFKKAFQNKIIAQLLDCEVRGQDLQKTYVHLFKKCNECKGEEM